MQIYRIYKESYFLYFGIIGIFVPFFNLYCFHLGFTGMQIAILNTIASLIVGFVPIVFGWLIDRKLPIKKVYLILNWLSTLSFIFICWVDNFYWMCLVVGIYFFFRSPLISILETVTLITLEKNSSSIHYGTIRLWGSIGFSVTTLFAGIILEWIPMHYILWLIVLISIIYSLKSHQIDSYSDIHRPLHELKNPHSINIRLIIYFFMMSLMMQASHASYYNFFSIHLELLGFSPVQIGIFWIWGVLAEIVLFIYYQKIFSNAKYEKIFMLCLLMTMIRWVSLSVSRHFMMIFLSQSLHCFSFGVFHITAIRYIAMKNGKTIGQSLYTAISYGIGLTLGRIVSGYYFNQENTFVIFYSSALFSVLAGIFSILLYRQSIKNNEDSFF